MRYMKRLGFAAILAGAAVVSLSGAQTAVLVDAGGQATIVANADHTTPFAYFIRGGTPQTVAAKTPLTYLNLQVQRAQPGSTFDLLTWTGTALTAYTLNVNGGAVSSTQPGGSIY